VKAIQGTPYVPGRARGVLARAPRAGGILLIAQSELCAFDPLPAGVLVVEGAPFSHAMIGLLALGVPTVLVTRAQATRLTEGMTIAVDGASGRVEAAGPASESGAREPTPPLSGRPVQTADGVSVELRASVRDAAAAARARARGAHSIGLVRTEFLIPPDDRLPDAGFYRHAFDELCAAASPLSVTLRLLDIAADKRPAWLGELGALAGTLGLQGARLYDHEPVRGVISAQLEAVAQLMLRHHLRLLVPYVVRVEELRRVRERIEARLPRRPLIGAMLETPAAALDIAQFCEEAEFVALGTNDLMQCLFAADRDLPELRGYLDPHAPVLYRFLRQVAESADAHLLKVQICGVLSQLPGVFPLLLGLGYRVFSVDPVFIPYLARELLRTDSEQARALAARACEARSSEALRALLGLPAAS
jgi:phosphoenolpyruvate-protein kinase (PTS system EI component)